ncbi:MAG: aminotransferase class I/II-fold pyridoxal phosphate-dependent enzyme [Planctomycetota bacterium]|jgi:LL-diaminopimelate aminotransferase
MGITLSKRIQSIEAYAFAEVDRRVEALKGKGIDPIDFGVGDPTDPTPQIVREACRAAVATRACAGYPPYVGTGEFRKGVAAWMEKRFGVSLDPGTEITSTVGSKEAVFHMPLAFLDPGDIALVPTPGYPPYQRGTFFAGGEVYFLPLVAENGFLPDLDGIPEEVRKRAKILWLNYPNSPTGRVAPPAFLDKAVRFGRENDILVASDEAYSEIYFGDPPRCALEFGREGVIAVFSLSKRSAMTTYRVGWVCGDREAVGAFKKVKTNLDSGTPTFIQDAAMVALTDETHVQEMREAYRRKAEILVGVFRDVGFPTSFPDGTLYIWQRLPDGMESEEFCLELLDPAVAVVATPGPWISDALPDGTNPGIGFVRFALVPSEEDVAVAGDRIRRAFGG